jgi:hypothetical protein
MMTLFHRESVMNPLKLAKIFPFIALFAQGRPIAGAIAFLLQLSLIFWPVAARWAYVSHERMGIERLLGELSETNKLAVDPYSRAPKKFRQLA